MSRLDNPNTPVTERLKMSRHINVIFIRATTIEDMGNGTFRVEMPGIELSNEDRKFIEKLYPTMADKAYELLDKEALLNSVASPSEIQAPSKDATKPAKVKKRYLDDVELP